MSQLLILGNGFDLQCGLKSSYKDFFECCILYKHGAMFNLQKMKNAPEQPFGFWEKLLFEYYKKNMSADYKWCDIETIIKETLWLINFGSNSETPLNTSEGLWMRASVCHERNIDPKDEAEKITDSIIKYSFKYCADFFYKNTPLRNRISDTEKRGLLNKLLLQELKNLEKRFCKYLKDNIFNTNEKRELNEKAINDEYLLNAINLLIKLTAFTTKNFETIEDILKAEVITEDAIELIDEFQALKDTHILSFNYTALFDILATKSPCIYSNVHGKLCLEKCNTNCASSSIIFGIDDSAIHSQCANDELRLFSKTYRKLFDTNLPINILPPNNKPVTIKFYGHSLSGADYSYFQSLFDYYNLYDNSKVDLIFYYSNGYEQTDSIYRLINSYGKTIANKEQGKNLMHKLLLENRIKIVEVSL